MYGVHSRRSRQAHKIFTKGCQADNAVSQPTLLLLFCVLSCTRMGSFDGIAHLSQDHAPAVYIALRRRNTCTVLREAAGSSVQRGGGAPEVGEVGQGGPQGGGRHGARRGGRPRPQHETPQRRRQHVPTARPHTHTLLAALREGAGILVPFTYLQAACTTENAAAAPARAAFDDDADALTLMQHLEAGAGAGAQRVAYRGRPMRSPRVVRAGQAPGGDVKRNPNAISTVVSVRADVCAPPPAPIAAHQRLSSTKRATHKPTSPKCGDRMYRPTCACQCQHCRPDRGLKLSRRMSTDLG